MTYLWIGTALLMAAINWIAVWKDLKSLEYITKPGVMVILLVGVGLDSGFVDQMIWFGIGLLFSLAGDIFLMLPRVQLIPGLVSFLFTHLAYIAGFNPTPPPLNVVSLILAVFLIVASGRVFLRLKAGLQNTGKQKLILPVTFYSIAIILMLYSALLTLVREEWFYLSAISVSVGALLFYISDTIKAWDLFVSSIPRGKLRVRIPYHLGQILIILGAFLHYTT